MSTKVKQKRFKKNVVYRFFKRAADIVLSLLAIILLSPVFLVTVIAIAIEDGRPFFYNQKRVGRNKSQLQ